MILRHRGFVAHLGQRLQQLIDSDRKEVPAPVTRRWGVWQRLCSSIVFHVLRRFPVWASRLPRHVPGLQLDHLAHLGVLPRAGSPLAESPHRPGNAQSARQAARQPVDERT